MNLKVEDYFQAGRRSLLRFCEKGDKEKEIPVHHKLEEAFDAYLDASGLRAESDSPLFRTTGGTRRKLGPRAMTRIDCAHLLKSWLKDVGIPRAYTPPSFRTTGIMAFLEEGARWSAGRGLDKLLRRAACQISELGTRNADHVFAARSSLYRRALLVGRVHLPDHAAK